MTIVVRAPSTARSDYLENRTSREIQQTGNYWRKIRNLRVDLSSHIFHGTLAVIILRRGRPISSAFSSNPFSYTLMLLGNGSLELARASVRGAAADILSGAELDSPSFRNLLSIPSNMQHYHVAVRPN